MEEDVDPQQVFFHSPIGSFHHKSPLPNLPDEKNSKLPVLNDDQPTPTSTSTSPYPYKPALPSTRSFYGSKITEEVTEVTQPFLQRFPIKVFSISLGLSSLANLWHTLFIFQFPWIMYGTSIPAVGNTVPWCVALAVYLLFGVIYVFKICFQFAAVKEETNTVASLNFCHPFLISEIVLTIGAPPVGTRRLAQEIIFWFNVVLQTIFAAYLYRNWLGRLPSTKISSLMATITWIMIGNLGPIVDRVEVAHFCFTIGLSFYGLIFICLFLNPSLADISTRAEELPLLFLFIAPPSAASVAWFRIEGDYSFFCASLFYFSCFLYIMMLLRVQEFIKSTFSITWWAYTFPMNTFAVASIYYAQHYDSYYSRFISLLAILFAHLTLVVTLWKTIRKLSGLFPDVLPPKPETELRENVCTCPQN